MHLHRVTAAVAAMSLASPAIAQTAVDAFECKLPYRAAMESLGGLTVAKEETKPASALLGERSIVEFAPGATRVLGQAPARLLLSIIGPTTKPGDNSMSISFDTIFANDARTDEALSSATDWARCGGTVGVCMKDGVPKRGEGQLQYWRTDKNELRVTCKYSLTVEDLAQ